MTIILPLLSYILIILAISQRLGTYTPFALLLLVIAFALLLVSTMRARKNQTEITPFPHRILAWFLILLLLIGMHYAAILHPSNRLFLAFVRLSNFLSVIAVLLFFIIGKSTRARTIVWSLLIATAVAFRIAVPFFSPEPQIDVYTNGQESAQHLLQGRNPYTTEVSDPYHGQANFDYEIFGYMYLPSALYLQVVGYLFGDVRFMSVIAECVFAFALWWLLKKSDPTIRQIVPLFALWNPRALFVIEQSWTEPLMLLMFSIFLLLYEANKRPYAAAVYGYLLSMKHSLFYFLFHWLILERSMRNLAIGMGVAILTLVPFFLWDPASVWEYGILFHFKTGFRPDSLSLTSPLYHLTGFTIGKWVGMLIAAIPALAVPYVLRPLSPLLQYLYTVSITTFTVFMFGSQAFANYYYFVGGLLLFLIAENIKLSEEVKPSTV